MANVIPLNGDDWLFKDFYGEDWVWRGSHKPDTKDVRHWRTGNVPGSIHDDLWRVGEIPNPYFERNSLLLEWIPDRTWIYKKTFFAPDDLRGKRLRIVFEGVDYEGQFFLNGELLGNHRSMYTPAAFDVTDHLSYGADNLIAVVIEPAPYEQPQVGRSSRVRTHKSRMTYWWDFCPRMIHLGIWQDVYLEATGAARITNVFVRPQLSDDLARANISVAAEIDAAVPLDANLEITISHAGAVVAQYQTHHTFVTGTVRLSANLTLENPHLWYPNGHGAQPLYEAQIRLTSASRIMHDQRVVRFGIRKIELVSNETPDTTALPYTFVVNGQKLYLKGWNWVPLDVMYGVPRPEKLDHLLRLAQRAHVNLLRVWGGGLIEIEAFYNHCDELGIMVWQEFIQSSSGIDNIPPVTPEMTDFMVHEAEAIIPRRRNHPSLAVWCGGNELTAAENVPLDDAHPMLAALHETVARLDPDRLWLPTSPSGRIFEYALENIVRDPLSLHDVHGPWEFQGVSGQQELYNAGTSLLHGEFGVEGITNLKSLNATIASEHQAPVALENPLWQHLGAWWVKLPMWQKTFGAADEVETLVRATQYIQAEGLRYALEADRRRKYQNSGTLPWQFNEPYPMAACTSAVDYYGQPKPAYYAVARAYEPLHLSAKFPTIAWAGREVFEAEIWVANSHTAVQNARLTARLIGFSGRIYAEQTFVISVAANSAARLAAFTFPLAELTETVFFLDLALRDDDSVLMAHSRYAFSSAANLESLLAIPPSHIVAKTVGTGDRWQVAMTNDSDQTAFVLWLEDSRPITPAHAYGTQGFVYFEDNYFSLLPGESRTVAVQWHNIPSAERSLTLSGWNTNIERLSSESSNGVQSKQILNMDTSSMPSQSDVSRFIEYCRKTLDIAGVKVSEEYGYSSLPLCVIDAVFSIGVNYKSTQNTVERFCKYADISKLATGNSTEFSVDEFLEIYRGNSVEYMAREVYRNLQRTSTSNGILKAEAVLRVAETLAAFGANYRADAPKVIGNSRFEVEFMKIPGQRSGVSLRYFYMLAGSENDIKPDRMILRFINSAIQRQVKLDEAHQLIIEACHVLSATYPDLTPRKLDNVIWQFQRAQS